MPSSAPAHHRLLCLEQDLGGDNSGNTLPQTTEPRRPVATPLVPRLRPPLDRGGDVGFRAPVAFDDSATAVAVLQLLERAAANRSGCRNLAAGTAVPASEEPFSRFHSSVLAAITLPEVARAVIRARIGVDWTTVALAVVLFARYDATVRPVTAHMAHRLFAACVLVAAKAHQDVMPSNRLMARSVGLSPREMSLLELDVMRKLRWRLIVRSDDATWCALVTATAASAQGLCREEEVEELSSSSWLSPCAASTEDAGVAHPAQ